MIYTCKYCGTQIRRCDKCAGEVISRTISDVLPNKPYKVTTTLVLCTNSECDYYAIYLKENSLGLTTFVCEAEGCKQAQRDAEEASSKLTL